MKFKIHVLGCLLMTSSMNAAMAAQFCVTNVSELNTALMLAENNGQDDEIRLTEGVYVGSFDYNAAANENFDLSISGGWTPFFEDPCFFEGTNAFETILDGDNTDLVLRILPEGNANIEVKSLTIINGQSTIGVVGGLDIFANTTFGDVLIERVALINNTGELIGALRVINGDLVNVRNSLFTLNSNQPSSNNQTSSSTATIINNESASAAGIYFNNNTVINNTTLGAVTPNAGIKMSRTGTENGIFIANNLFRNNDGHDINVPVNFDLPQVMYNNNFESYTGVISNDVFTSGNYTQEPIYATSDLFDYTPDLSSGEINAGRGLPPFIPVPTPFGFDWDLGETDIMGRIRVADDRPDVGAYEAPAEVPIFTDDFE